MARERDARPRTPPRPAARARPRTLKPSVDPETVRPLLGAEVARFLGSWRFIGYMTAFIIAWILFNALAPDDLRFDPFPFIFLTLLLSLQASYAAPLILLAQNRQADRDRVQYQDDRDPHRAPHRRHRVPHPRDRLAAHRPRRGRHPRLRPQRAARPRSTTSTTARSARRSRPRRRRPRPPSRSTPSSPERAARRPDRVGGARPAPRTIDACPRPCSTWSTPPSRRSRTPRSTAPSPS